MFIYDDVKAELWTKAAKGLSTIIRIPIGVGIAGSVVRTGKTENIVDVYEDPRFNPSFDKRNNYRTRSVLVTPVKDS